MLLALVSLTFYLGYERRGVYWRYALAVAVFLLSVLAKGTAPHDADRVTRLPGGSAAGSGGGTCCASCPTS